MITLEGLNQEFSFHTSEAASQNIENPNQMIKKFLIVFSVFTALNVFAQTDTTKTQTPKDSASIDNTFNVPLFSTSGGDLEGDLEQQDVSSLLM